jgi:MFS family permease
MTGGICQLPGGWLADRIGPRIVVTISISGVALAGLLVGLSQTYIMVIIFLVLMAVMSGGYHPASVAAISSLIEPQNRGRALGIHLIGGNASIFVAPLLAAAIAVVWGWRGSYITLAIPAVILGILIYILLGRQVVMDKIGNQLTDVNTSSNEVAPPAHRLRHLVPFLILSVSTGGLIHSVRAFVPLYAVDQFGIGEETAAALMALIPLAGLWGSPLGGYLSDRLGRIAVPLTVCLLAGPVVYLFNLVPYGLAFGAMLILIGMINSIRMPTSEAYLVSQTSQRRRSTILGIYFFTGREIGGLLAPVAGYLIDRLGFHSSFNIISIVLVVVTLSCSVFLWRNKD